MIDCVGVGLTTSLCHLPEKGRREIEEIVEKMKERDMGEKKENKW